MKNKKYNWKKAILKSNATIKSAIQNLVDTSLQIVLIISKNQKLIGTVTDGDIRRGILAGADLNDKVEKIMKRDPIKITNELDKKTIKFMMRANSLLQLPIVDENNKIKGLHLWNDYFNKELKENTIVIMAGGFGKRMMPETKSIPKPMLKVNNKPILEHIIINIRDYGFKNIVITTHYLGDTIKKYFKDGKKLGVNIIYTNEKKPLGTCGALSLIKIKKNEPIIVTNGDVISDINFVEILKYHKFHNADATIAVRNINQQNQFGVIESNGIEVKDIIEKPVMKIPVNAGIYVLNKNLIKRIPKNKSMDMTNFLLHLKKNKKKIIIFPIHEVWKDIGRPSDIKKN